MRSNAALLWRPHMVVFLVIRVILLVLSPVSPPLRDWPFVVVSGLVHDAWALAAKKKN